MALDTRPTEAFVYICMFIYFGLACVLQTYYLVFQLGMCLQGQVPGSANQRAMNRASRRARRLVFGFQSLVMGMVVALVGWALAKAVRALSSHAAAHDALQRLAAQIMCLGLVLVFVAPLFSPDYISTLVSALLRAPSPFFVTLPAAIWRKYRGVLDGSIEQRVKAFVKLEGGDLGWEKVEHKLNESESYRVFALATLMLPAPFMRLATETRVKLLLAMETNAGGGDGGATDPLRVVAPNTVSELVRLINEVEAVFLRGFVLTDLSEEERLHLGEARFRRSPHARGDGIATRIVSVFSRLDSRPPSYKDANMGWASLLPKQSRVE